MNIEQLTEKENRTYEDRRLDGSSIIMECLLEQGVDTVFGYPGGKVLNIYDALYRYSDRITHILTSHEQNAAHAADGYARSTGKTGVVIATSGPGATNLVTGIATAFMDSIPMVAITGNVPTGLLGLDSFQEVDITGITMPVTKHNYIVKDISKLADTVREAFAIAGNGRKGPVLIDIPQDITSAFCSFANKPATIPEPQKRFTLDGEITNAAQVITQSRKPFIYAGGGVVSADAQKELERFAELVDAPVSLSLMGQCAFDNTSERYIGMMGMHGTKTSSLAIGECDLLIVLGSRFSDRVMCDDSFARHTRVLHIDIDPAEINKNVSVQDNVIGDLKYILSELNRQIPPQSHKDWMEQIRAWEKQYPLVMDAGNTQNTVLPNDVMETLDKLTEGKAIITTEVGQHQMWTAQFFRFREKGTFLTSGGLGTMGYGLGAAIGAKIGNPDKAVINIAGDGSFYMNLTELSTLAKYGIPVVELVMDNRVLGMVRQWQKLFFGGRFSNTTLEKNTDFRQLAAAFGIEFYEITEKSAIEPTLKAAIELNKPALVICKICEDVNVLPMVPPGGSVLEPIMTIDS
ncbi:MAG: biosynthetic-type acetolactate synthase large subunit [Oscillospiraceae bacterium]|jgi:acetolactate synthase-1/2/3 large subunit|nr:biosynthetic-type acetolactate synthase large subunit [Oscillospiraceae bacterium]